MAQHYQAASLMAAKGIELLTYGTPNGQKISVLLEELRQAYGIDYTVQSIDIFAGATKAPWFKSLNPNGKIPVIVDHDAAGLVVWESLTIAKYLVKKYDVEKRFWFGEDDKDDGGRGMVDMDTWGAWSHGNLNTIQAQANFYYRFSPLRHPAPTYRFVTATTDLYAVLDAHLTDRTYMTGTTPGKYSVADILIWPYINACSIIDIDLNAFSALYKWWQTISKREAVKRGMLVPSGKVFQFGFEEVRQRKLEDPEGWKRQEAPLIAALEQGRKECKGP